MNKIAELKQQRAAVIAQARALLDKADTEKRSLTQDEESQYTALVADAESRQKEIERQEKQLELERSLGEHRSTESQPQTVTQAPNVIPGGIKEDLEPGIRMARYVKSTLLSQKEGRSFEEVAKRMYPKDNQLLEARGAMSTSAPVDGGVLVPDTLSQEIIPYLREQSSIRSLGARTVPMPNGNIKISKQTGAANFQWVGENQPIVSSKVPLGMISLLAKKLAGTIPISNELIASSLMSADQFVRDELINGIAEAEDITALYGKGTDNTPLGIYNISSAKTNLGAIPTGDTPGAIIGIVMGKKFPNKKAFGWVFNGILWPLFYNMKDGSNKYIYRDEMNQGRLGGYPFAINNNVTVGTDSHAMTQMFFGDFSQFLIGESLGLQIAMSTEASYNDGGSLVSAFANDQTVMRALLREDFGARYDDAFVVYDQVWTK